MTNDETRMTNSAETIAAVSSPAGASARAIVRLSGPGALACAEALFSPSVSAIQNPKSKIQNRADWSVACGYLAVPAFCAAVPCLLMVMRAPRSYTREDVVEFHVPGSPPVAAGVLEAVLGQGARLARPGEFTERAFLSGRIDLAQAEAVMKLIHAAGEAEGRLAVGELGGALSRRIDAIAERLVETLAQAELALDFSEDDVPAMSAEDLARAVEAAAGDIDELRRSAPANAAFSERPRVSIVGRANAGKSSLFNRLPHHDAAIVTSVAGTTRDVLEEETDLDGAKLLLVDTAGERGAASTDAANPDEQAIARAREESARADLLLLVIDASEPLTAVDVELLDRLASGFPRPPLGGEGKGEGRMAASSSFVVLNKSDLSCSPDTVETVRSRALAIDVSCATGEGLDRLRSEIRERLLLRGVARPGSRFLLNLRQVDSLRLASEALARAKQAADGALGLELIADDLRAAINRLRSLTRPLDPDELLDRIFSRFCIGK